jgi:hypothetical protein
LGDPAYVAKLEADVNRDDWAGITGGSAHMSAPAVVKKKLKKAESERDADAAPVVKKKVIKPSASAEGEAPAIVKKKKVVKKVEE